MLKKVLMIMCVFVFLTAQDCTGRNIRYESSDYDFTSRGEEQIHKNTQIIIDQNKKIIKLLEDKK